MTLFLHQTIKQQCLSFQELDYEVSYTLRRPVNHLEPKVTIGRNGKEWHFADPDWDIVVRQIAQLYKTIMPPPRKSK